MLRLDMSQAFDRLPRTELAGGFQLLAPESTLASIMLHWLTHVRYHINHRGHHAVVETSRGVRQGCKASPLEWTVFLRALFQKLDAAMSSFDQPWTLPHLITYADDLIAKWLICDPEDFYQCLIQLGLVFDVLESIGMKVNMQKTVILLRLEGSKRCSIIKKYTYLQNGSRFLWVPKASGRVAIPIVHEHVYLGTKISFFKFEDKIFEHRLHIGKVTFLRLRPLLTGRRALPLALRVRLWIVCVRSSYVYGLEAAGLTTQGCQTLHRRFARDLRQLGRSPSHLTHESTKQLHHRLGLQLPLEHLLQIWSLSHDRRRAALAGLSHADILWQFDFDTHYQTILSTLQAATEQPAITQELQCPYCSYLAPLPATLTRHLRTTHHISVAPVLFRMLRDAKQGTPQCMHCQRVLASIRNLRQHIHLSSCRLFDEHLAWQEPLADSCDLRRMVLAPSWTEIWHQTDTLQKLRHECAICQHWTPNNRALSEHLHREHRSTWHRTQSLAQSLMHHLPSGASTIASMHCKST